MTRLFSLEMMAQIEPRDWHLIEGFGTIWQIRILHITILVVFIHKSFDKLSWVKGYILLFLPIRSSFIYPLLLNLLTHSKQPMKSQDLLLVQKLVHRMNGSKLKIVSDRIFEKATNLLPSPTFWPDSWMLDLFNLPATGHFYGLIIVIFDTWPDKLEQHQNQH